MRTSRALAKQIVSTYASVLFDAAAADDAVDEVFSQMEAVQRIVRGHAPLRDALTDDSVSGAQRAKVVTEVFAGLNPALVSTLVVLADRGSFDLFSSVVEAYGIVAEDKRGVVAVDVTTAVELTDSLRESITKKLAADMGKSVIIREKVDPSIIGGVVFSTHGQRIDASIASQLENARVVLSTAHTGGEA
jgi:F-type H+-transporting ATPase subunit delta